MYLILNAEIKEASKSRGGIEVEVTQVERCAFHSGSAHIIFLNITQSCSKWAHHQPVFITDKRNTAQFRGCLLHQPAANEASNRLG